MGDFFDMQEEGILNQQGEYIGDYPLQYKKYPFQCDECKKGFNKKHGYKQHIKDKHTLDEKDLKIESLTQQVAELKDTLSKSAIKEMGNTVGEQYVKINTQFNEIMNLKATIKEQAERIESYEKWMIDCKAEFASMIGTFKVYSPSHFENTIAELKKSIVEIDNLLTPDAEGKYIEIYPGIFQDQHGNIDLPNNDLTVDAGDDGFAHAKIKPTNTKEK